MSSNDEPRTPEQAGRMHSNGELENDPSEEFPFNVPPEYRYLVGAVAGIEERLAEQNAHLSQLNSTMEAYVSALQGAVTVQQQAQASQGNGADPSSAETVSATDHDCDESEMESRVRSWLESAESFHSDLESEWCRVEFGEVENRVGVIIDTGKPWDTPCHSGESWTDKDRFDDHREALKAVTQSADEYVEYHGEPDYFNFLPATDVDEVTE